MNESSSDCASDARAFALPFAAGLFVVAFAIRIGLVLLLRDPTLAPAGLPYNDDVQFNHLATSLVNGEGYVNHLGVPTSFRAPGFPFFLAGLYAIFGFDTVTAYVVFCVLGALNCVFAYGLARELLREMQARWVGVLSALYLGHLTVSLAFVSENLFVPLFTLGCWLFVRFLRHENFLTLGGSGLAIGLATVTRPFSLLLLGLWGLILCWQYRRRPVKLLLSGFIFAVPFLTPILPWTLRNYQVHGHLVLMATNGGSTFYGSANDTVYSNPRFWGYWVPTTQLPGRAEIEAAPNEYEHDRKEWELGKEWIRANPGKAAFVTGMKVVSLWIRPPEFDINQNPVYALRLLAYAPLFLLMCAGFVRCLWRRRYWTAPWMTLHLAIFATMFTAMIFCGIARFRDANVSLLMIYAVVGWEGLATFLRRRKSTPPLAA